ncbi:hypothetical protein SCG7086_AB_00080 [Chlamydiales bacterium SCGC AG-110-P3]|nr:hypothetical protein SCG7086_AB_00080 [Chlamydiales bacterium SCGC AG-110-P3]
MIKNTESDRVLISNENLLNPWSSFHDQTKINENKVAVIDENEKKFTFHEIYRQSISVSEYLAAQGVKKHSRVTLVSESSRLCLITILALMRCGAVIVPVDNRYPEKTINQIYEDSLSTHLLVNNPENELLNSLIVDDAAFEQDFLAVQESILQPDELGFILNTSGSSGPPKGVEMPIRLHCARNRVVDPYKSSVSVFKGSISWIDVLPLRALAQGNSVLIVQYQDLLDPKRYLEKMLKHGVDLIDTVPSHLKILTKEKELLSQFSQVHVSGEPIDDTLITTIKTEFPEIILTEHYGCTETLGYGASRVLSSPSVKEPTPWKADAAVNIYIIDEEGEEVSPGEKGEIVIAGPQLSLGYTRSELNKKCFICDTLGESKLYRTGDLALRRENNSFYLAGRIDSQVQIHGIRIEPKALESYSLTLTSVIEAFGTPVDTPTGQRLALYLTPKTVNLDEVKDHLSEYLPIYSMPYYYLTLDKLPRLPTGKVDRKELPEPHLLNTHLTNKYENPKNTTESKLLSSWKKVLKIASVGVYDNFFELGGHSLLLIELIHSIKKGTGTTFTIYELIDNPTISQQAKLIARSQESKSDASSELASSIKEGERKPASYAQTNMICYESSMPKNKSYNTIRNWRIQGDLSTDCLYDSIKLIVERHQILRSTFEVDDGFGFLITHPNETIDCKEISAIGKDLNEKKEWVDRAIETEYNKRFNLSCEHPIRIRIYKLDTDLHILSVIIHHCATDAWSWSLFTHELSLAYSAIHKQQKPVLPTLEIQYTDYAFWQSQQITESRYAAQYHYIKDQLTDLPTLKLSDCTPGNTGNRLSVAKHTFSLPTELSNRLKGYSQRNQVTEYMVLLAVYQQLLGGISRQEKFLVTSVLNRRHLFGTKDLMGYFVDSIPYRTNLASDRTLYDQLNSITRFTLASLKLNTLPFEILFSLLREQNEIKSSFANTAAINIVKKRSTHRLDIPDLIIDDISIPSLSTTSPLDLLLFASISDDSCSITFTYNVFLFSIKRISDFEKEFSQLLAWNLRR